MFKRVLNTSKLSFLRGTFLQIVKRPGNKTYRLSGAIILSALFLHLLFPLQCLGQSLVNNPNNQDQKQSVLSRGKSNLINGNVKKIDTCCLDANLFSVYQEPLTASSSFSKVSIYPRLIVKKPDVLLHYEGQLCIHEGIHFSGIHPFRSIYLSNSTFLD